MKLLVLLMDPFWMVVIACLVVYIFSLRRRIAALNDPRLMLSRKERKAWARKELTEREKQHELDRFQRNYDIIRGKEQQQ